MRIVYIPMKHALSSTMLLALLSFTMACPTAVSPKRDADVMQTPTPSLCAQACARMNSLSCPEANPRDSGDTCEQVCDHTIDSGLFDMKPACLAAAQTLDDLHACGTVVCAVSASTHK
jgi:hypothetical protein